MGAACGQEAAPTPAVSQAPAAKAAPKPASAAAPKPAAAAAPKEATPKEAAAKEPPKADPMESLTKKFPLLTADQVQEALGKAGADSSGKGVAEAEAECGEAHQILTERITFNLNQHFPSMGLPDIQRILEANDYHEENTIASLEEADKKRKKDQEEALFQRAVGTLMERSAPRCPPSMLYFPLERTRM